MVEKDKTPYKGTVSSVILSLFVLFLFLVPIITANGIDKVRKGNGKYNFKETICFDINDDSQFEDDPDLEADCGEGAMGFWYDEYGFSLNEITLMDYPINDTIDEYGVGITSCCDGDGLEYSVLFMFLTLTKDDIIDLDITRIDILLNVTNLEDDVEFEVYIVTEDDLFDDGFYLGELIAGKLNKFEIDISDILEINAFPEDEQLVLVFVPTEEEAVIQCDSTVVFDMQFYCIEEIKIPSLTKIGIWMLGISAFMIFCSYLMLPEVTFEGVINRIKKSLERFAT